MRTHARGFSLLELMIASSLSLAVLAAAISAGVAIQRMASLQNETVFTQNIARIAKDTVVAEIERAGAGVGGARINIGGSDNRYALEVNTDATYADTSWGAPTGAYAALTSDGLDLLTAEVSALVTLDDCNAGAGYKARNGINVCVADASAAALNGRTVIFANPNLGVGCVHKVTNYHETGGKSHLQIGPRDGANDPPSSEACAEANNDFWGAQGGMVMQMNAVGFRVNWGPSGDQPVFERCMDTLANPQVWEPVSRQIERIKVRIGVTNLTNPAGGLTWFPDAAAGRPAVDACDNATCLALVPGGTDTADPDAADPNAATFALLRRARLVELTITARSERRDMSAVKESGSGFEIDPESGYLLDGYRRRSFVVYATPRNMTFAGVTTP